MAPPFLETKEYRRFAEFGDSCHRERYIGPCYGPPGVDKTLSARHYARWEAIEAVVADRHFWMETPAHPELRDCRTVIYTPSMTATPKRLEDEVYGWRRRLHLVVEAAQHPDEDDSDTATYDDRWTKLVIVDEADRLTFPSLEQLRDRYDRGAFGLVLLGMPGLEKRLARYAQLYSRVGFVHPFRPLSADKLRFILEQRWRELGLTIDLTEFDDVEAMTAIIRITGGTFRLVQRLFAQMARIMAINQMTRVSKEVVEVARESLVIGSI
ncbi:MAG TPA: AAA family ATPase [Thermomicrobiales bacterium]|nr:AAA family ATPase [Thermomicrobiales bacterium]